MPENNDQQLVSTNGTVPAVHLPQTRGYTWAPRLDPNCGEYSLFVNQNNGLHITQGSPNIAITGMRVILNNTFAPMPVMGHSYAAAQFIGRGPTEVSFQLATIGDDALSHIQAMHETLEKNARQFRRFTGAGRVRFSNNDFLTLAGVHDGIITSFDTETDPNGTNLYRAQISFTSDGHHTESFRQENYVESNVLTDLLEGLLRKIFFRTVPTSDLLPAEARRRAYHPISSPFGDSGIGTAYSPVSGRRSIGDLVDSSSGSSIEGIDTLSLRGRRSIADQLRSGLETVENRRDGIASHQSAGLTSVWGITENARAVLDSRSRRVESWLENSAEEHQLNIRRGRFLAFPVRIRPSDQDAVAVYAPIESEQHSWLTSYLERIVDTFVEWTTRLPPHHFFVGDTRGQYQNLEGQVATADSRIGFAIEEEITQVLNPTTGRISNWPPLLENPDSLLSEMTYGSRLHWGRIRSSRITGLNNLEGAIAQFVSELMAIAQEVLIEGSGREESFETLFPGIVARYISSPVRTAHPCYPDLELPNHPVSNMSIDTEPDFYFFNDGEDGLLNQIGPEILNEMQIRIANMETSFARLASGSEWRETYLGRSRIGVDLDEYNEEEEISLNPNTPYRGFDVGSGSSLDNSTTEGREGNINWGPQEEGGGRNLGGRGVSVENVIDRVLSMSPTVTSSVGSGGGQETLVRRRIEMMRSSTTGIGQDANQRINIGPVDTTITGERRQHTFSRSAVREVAEQSIAQNAESTLTMRRAFPTFKIYFIEDDAGATSSGTRRLRPAGRPIAFFDDLYNYNSVKSIRLIRSRKNPAALLILTLTNVQGLLERRQWSDPYSPEREIYMPGFEETELENPLKKIIMKEGLKVQARLGNSNNPYKLGNKFVGEVVEFSFNAEVSDEVTIICQSYGAELELEQKGIQTGARNTFIDTPDLLHTIMCSTELAHFGRFDINQQFNPAEARSAATSRRDASTGQEETRRGIGLLLENPRLAFQDIQADLNILRTKWIIANNAADDNIFAPGIRDQLSEWDRLWQDVGNNVMVQADWWQWYSDSLGYNPEHGFLDRLWRDMIPGVGAMRGISQVTGWWAAADRWIASRLSTSNIILSGQTPWQIFKEAELRHPGFIAQPRPYGTRETMFFGMPSHPYWADQQTREEMVILQRLQQSVRDRIYNDQVALSTDFLRSRSGNGGAGTGYLNSGGLLDPIAMHVYARTLAELASSMWLQNVGETIASTLGRFRPFRRYHLITSDHHLLMNNIRASAKGTFNAVSLQYAGNKVYTLKADDSIPDEKTRTEYFQYPSCANETMARRYCAGLLMRHLKDVYKGEVVIIGQDVDPYDICYLHDDRTGMYGMFEVEQVVDTFTAETGWITEITPDMITGTNEWVTQSTNCARAAALGLLSQRYLNYPLTTTRATSALGLAALGSGVATTMATRQPLLGLATGALVAVGGALAWTGGYHIIRWTQDRQPIWVTPLILGERPFFSGLDGFSQDGIFASVRGQLHAEIDAFQEGWRQFHLGAMASDMGIGIARGLSGQNVVG